MSGEHCHVSSSGLACRLVADDLTGAADAGAKFVARGLSGAVLLSPAPNALDADLDVDLLAINTDTRRGPEAVARCRMHDVAGPFVRRGRAAAIFKKIDSTLRGHVGAELDAALDTFGCSHAIVAPAFPSMGRVVRIGALIVHGPSASVQTPRDVLSLLASQGLRAGAATIGAAATRAMIDRALSEGARVLVCDATTHAHLDAIVDAAWPRDDDPRRPLWVGSAGLADAIAKRLALARPHARAAPTAPSMPRAEAKRAERVILFIGSTHPATRAQKARLASTGDERAMLVEIDWRHTTPEALLATTAPRQDLAGYVMSGGDTAANICLAMGATAIRIGGEVANGVPWGVLIGGIADGVPVVLKSGGFGPRKALVDAVHFLTHLHDRHARTS
jgi:uncharacterized protein YgbK (DUF1537 family)